MARVRLVVQPARGRRQQSYVERDGRVLPLHQFRLTTRIRVGRRLVTTATAHASEAIVDTGSPLSSFPRAIWSAFENEIEWLALAETEGQSGPPTIAVAGQRFPFRLGRISVTVTDFEGRHLAATPILALFVDEPLDARPPPVLLGLWRGIFDGRRLVLGPALEDPAGQDWWLEDA